MSVEVRGRSDALLQVFDIGTAIRCASNGLRANRVMPNVKFTYSSVGCDRKHYLTEEDVRVVLSRLPIEAWNGLRKVHFNDRSRGARRLGYANPRDREIAICALPPRLSMTAALLRGQSPELFGAVRGKQWPELAVRRFLLYDVLLHELGHLRMVILNRASGRRACSRETRAEQFADYWRKRLWSEHLDHPDPVHNPPSPAESSTLS